MTETSSQCSAPVEPSPDSCPCGRGPLQRQQSLAGVAHASASSALRTTTNRPQTQTSVCGIHPRPAALLGQWGAWMNAFGPLGPLEASGPTGRTGLSNNGDATSNNPCLAALELVPDLVGRAPRSLLPGTAPDPWGLRAQHLSRWLLPAADRCLELAFLWGGGSSQTRLSAWTDSRSRGCNPFCFIVLGFLRSQNVRIDSHFRSWNVSIVFSTNILLPITLLIACFSLFVVSGVDVTGIFHAAVQLSREFPCPSTCLSSDYIIISLNLPSTPYIYIYIHI